MVPLLITLGVVLVIVVIFISIYNKLVMLRERFKNAFAQIDVQLRRRYDLIPNLVETVKGYMAHEKETLVGVTEARNQALAAAKAASANPGEPGAMLALGSAESLLSKALGGLNVVMEQYPDLKANESMASLQEEMKTTENKIAFARQAFNDSVTSFNIGRSKFPNIIVAGSFGFKEASLLEIDFEEGERNAPKVSF